MSTDDPRATIAAAIHDDLIISDRSADKLAEWIIEALTDAGWRLVRADETVTIERERWERVRQIVAAVGAWYALKADAGAEFHDMRLASLAIRRRWEALRPGDLDG